MFKNYVVFALRNARRHKLYSFINVVGLAIALATVVFIMLFAADELSYDRFIPNMGDVYRVDSGYKFPGEEFSRNDGSPFPLGAAMKAHIPQVAAYTHIVPVRVTLKADGRLFSQVVERVDPGFLKVIRLKVLAGDPQTALSQPESVVLSRRMALKLFGSAVPLGKTVTINGSRALTVTAVIKTLPHNTQLKADVVLPNTSKIRSLPTWATETDWLNFADLYVRLVPGSDPNRVLGLVKQIEDRSFPTNGMFHGIPTVTMLRPHLTPFVQVHLSPYGSGLTPGGSWIELYGLAAVGALILLMACFNFTNLATARAILRTREVALRKALGARRSQLITQFLAEAVMTATASLALALALVELLSSPFDRFIGRPLGLHELLHWWPLVAMVFVTLLAGILGGLYPAVVLSSFRPANALRDGQGRKGRSGLLRTGLVALQFAVSIGLGVAAVVVFAQIRYAQHINTGFDHDHIIVVSNMKKMPQARRADFARALTDEPSISAAAFSENTPFEGALDITYAKQPGASHRLNVQIWNSGFNFLRFYHIRLLAGRALSSDHADDTWPQKVGARFDAVITKKAARLMGYTPSQAIGKAFRLDADPVTIVGVATNLRLNDPQSEMKPIVIVHEAANLNELSLRIRGGQVKDAVGRVLKEWHRYAPNTAIRWHFLDDTFNRMFASDVQRGRMFALSVGIAILIACLGLYGLAAITAQSRTREIGIRKTFGARPGEILRLLLWQFSVPVIIAILIAWPIAWYYLHGWLQGFAARITLSPAYFLAVGFAALVIAWLTVGAHALHAARTRTVNALRYE